MAVCNCSTCLTVIGVLVGVLAVVGMSCTRLIFDTVVAQILSLGEDKPIMEMFTIPPLPIYMEFYFFNVTNPQAVQYYGEKPVLQEVGPYVYEETRAKFDMVFKNEETTVEYLQNKTYFFREDLSEGLMETDVITTVNVLMVVLANMTYDTPHIGVIWPEIEHTMDVFEEHTIAEALFEGWDLPTFHFNFGHIPGTDLNLTLEGTIYEILLELGVPDDAIPPPVKENKIGYYNTKNNTNDGVYEVFTGNEDITEYITMYKWQHDTLLHFWKTVYCNMLNGTDGTQFPPNTVTKTSTVRIFVTDLCRSLYLTYDSESTHYGVNYLRFTAPPELLESPATNDDNKCFLSNMLMESGFMEMTPCLHIPIVMSLPHFLMGGGEEITKYVGLSPDKEKHETILDIEPTLGIPLAAHKRIQINLPIRKFGSLTSFMNFNDMFFPVLWADENAALSEEDASKLKTVLTLPFIVAYSVGGLLIVIALVLLVVGCRKCQKKSKTADKKVIMLVEQQAPRK